jgi:hypothetical protein
MQKHIRNIPTPPITEQEEPSLHGSGILSDQEPMSDIESPMKELSESCSMYYLYPQNIVGRKPPKSQLEAYTNKLSSEEKHLFSAEQAKVDVLTVRYSYQGSLINFT